MGVIQLDMCLNSIRDPFTRGLMTTTYTVHWTDLASVICAMMHAKSRALLQSGVFAKFSHLKKTNHFI